MRVLLAGDQITMRSALRLLLEQEGDIQVVGETADTTGLLLTVTQKAPELVLLDWELPGLPPVQLLRLLRYERPFLKIIAMSSRPETHQTALAAGVEAFVSKSKPPRWILAVIRGLNHTNNSKPISAHPLDELVL